MKIFKVHSDENCFIRLFSDINYRRVDTVSDTIKVTLMRVLLTEYIFDRDPILSLYISTLENINRVVV